MTLRTLSPPYALAYRVQWCATMTEQRRLHLLRVAYLGALTRGLWFAPTALARLIPLTAAALRLERA